MTATDTEPTSLVPHGIRMPCAMQGGEGGICMGDYARDPVHALAEIRASLRGRN